MGLPIIVLQSQFLHKNLSKAFRAFWESFGMKLARYPAYLDRFQREIHILHPEN